MKTDDLLDSTNNLTENAENVEQENKEQETFKVSETESADAEVSLSENGSTEEQTQVEEETENSESAEIESSDEALTAETGESELEEKFVVEDLDYSTLSMEELVDQFKTLLEKSNLQKTKDQLKISK